MASMENPHTKLLVVDDDPALRQLLADYLNRHGYDTLLAPDASDLANRITRYAPDLLVLDRMLPGGDGADACRRLREQGEDIPVILLTARDEAVDGSSAWRPAPMIMSASPSIRANCWRASRPCCAASAVRPR